MAPIEESRGRGAEILAMAARLGVAERRAKGVHRSGEVQRGVQIMCQMCKSRAEMYASTADRSRTI